MDVEKIKRIKRKEVRIEMCLRGESHEHFRYLDR
jgi:hypothetical protein